MITFNKLYLSKVATNHLFQILIYEIKVVLKTLVSRKGNNYLKKVKVETWNKVEVVLKQRGTSVTVHS